PAEMCPRCGAVWDRRNAFGRCILCGWPNEGAARRISGGSGQILLNLEKRVERYHQLGLITTEVRDRVVQALREKPRPAGAAPWPVPVWGTGRGGARGRFRERLDGASGARSLATVSDVASRARAYRDSLGAEEGRAPAPGSLPVSVPAPERSQRLLTL